MLFDKKRGFLYAGFLFCGLQIASGTPLKILVINQCGAFVRTTAINWMSRYLTTVVGPSQGWTMVVPATAAETQSKMRDDTLSTYQVIVFNNNTSIGGVIIDQNQRLAFQKWARQGGGIVAWHSFLDHADLWPFVTDSLLAGTKFTDHSNWNSTGGKNAQVRWDTLSTAGDATTNGVAMVRANRSEYATLKAGYPSGPFTYPDEWYSYRTNPRLATPSAVWGGYPRAVDVLMTIDENTYDVPTAVKMGPDHPIAWSYKLPPLTPGARQGRFIYNSRGRDTGSFAGVGVNAAPNGIDTGTGGIHNWIFQSIAWAAGVTPTSIQANNANPEGMLRTEKKNGLLNVFVRGENTHEVDVYTLAGKRIAGRTGRGDMNYSFSNLRTAAVYYVRVKSAGGTVTQRVAL